MRIAIVVYPMTTNDIILAVAEALSAGLTQQGHIVETIDLKAMENIRLGRFEYLCIGIGSASYFSSIIPQDFVRRFERVGGLSGKRSFGFVTNKTIFSERRLYGLMTLMESQGMYLRNSAVFHSPADARSTGLLLEVLSKV